MRAAWTLIGLVAGAIATLLYVLAWPFIVVAQWCEKRAKRKGLS